MPPAQFSTGPHLGTIWLEPLSLGTAPLGGRDQRAPLEMTSVEVACPGFGPCGCPASERPRRWMRVETGDHVPSSWWFHYVSTMTATRAVWLLPGPFLENVRGLPLPGVGGGGQ